VERANVEKMRRQVREGKAFVSGILFGSEVAIAGGPQGEIEREVIDADGLRPEDFVIPSIPRLSSRGTRRTLVAPIRGLRWSIAVGAATLEFELPKGAYATCLLREFMKS
jgi:tRNA pseudouridine13 synthase